MTYDQMMNRFETLRGSGPVECCICGKELSKNDEMEYSKPKGGRDLFFHRECYRKRGD